MLLVTVQRSIFSFICICKYNWYICKIYILYAFSAASVIKMVAYSLFICVNDIFKKINTVT